MHGANQGEEDTLHRVKEAIEERIEHFERLIKLPRIEHKEKTKGRLKELKALKNELGLDEVKEE